MHASGALGTIIGRVEGDIDPIEPWQESVGVIEGKRVRAAQEADIVECMDGMRSTKGLVWWLVLLGGDRIACGIFTRSRAMAQKPVFRTKNNRSIGEKRLTNIDRFAAIPGKIV
jgi:hypothetical protein